MRKWLNRWPTIPFIGGWAGLASFIVGLPGHIADVAAWLEWLAVADALVWLGVSVGFIVTGPLIWTSGWWLPRLKGKLPSKSAVRIILGKADIEYFRSMTPLIDNQWQWHQPISFMGTKRSFNPWGFHRDAAILKFRLDELGIPYPSSSSDSEWSYYLRRLSSLAKEGRIDDARSLHSVPKPHLKKGRD